MKHQTDLDEPSMAVLIAEMGSAYEACKEAGATDDANHLAFETLMFSLHQGHTVPPWAAEAVCGVHAAYQTYKIPSLSQAIGCPDHKQLKSKRKKVLCGVVAKKVHELRESATAAGRSLSKDEAIAEVAEWLGSGYSESTVRDLVTHWETLCKSTDAEPYGQPVPALANATKVIGMTLAAEFSRKSKHK